jgi:hypothetical protein
MIEESPATCSTYRLGDQDLIYLRITGRSKVDYDTVLADSEREAVADLLGYLENVDAPHMTNP